VLYLYEGLMTRQTGTSRAYLLKRLRRDGYGDLLAAVGSGRLSAYAAAEAAGYVTRRPVIGTGSQGQAKRRAARGRDDGQLMELWLGPSQRGPGRPRGAGAAGGGGDKPARLVRRGGGVAWGEFEAGDLRYPGYDRERSFLFERGLFADAERAEPHWREEFDRAHSPGCFHCAGPGKFLDGDAAPRAHFAFGRTFHPR